MNHELAVIVRAFITLFFIALIIRLQGKRGWRAILPLDLMIAIVLGNIGHALILGRTSLLVGISASATLIWIHLLLTIILQHSRPLRRIAMGTSTLLIRDGKVRYRALKHEHITDRELAILLHNAGIKRLGEIRELYMEVDGTLRLSLQEDHQRLTRNDICLSAGMEEDRSWRQAA